MVQEHRGSSNVTSPIAPSNSSPLLMARDPHHNRAPSLGELHQELEAEQEAQVVCRDDILPPYWLSRKLENIADVFSR